MVAHQTDSTAPTRTDANAETNWRYKCLLALALISHRRTADGLDADVTDSVAAVLAGELDV